MIIKRLSLLLILVVILTLGLAGCVRSSLPSGGVTPSVLIPGEGTPPGTTDVMGQLELFVTQTAMAAQGQAGGSPTQAPTSGAGETQGPTATAPAVEGPTSTPVPAAPTATLRPFPTLTPGIPSNYTLQSGEFPFCIARRFNVDPGELLSLNGLARNSTFYAGMTLKIPKTGNHFPDGRQLQKHPDTYTVRAGDTIYSIACQYGDVDPNAIALANGLSAPYKLNSGQKLQIP